MGIGCGDAEIGYLYGQYKRINPTFSSKGAGVLWGGTMPFSQARARAGGGVCVFWCCVVSRSILARRETWWWCGAWRTEI